jgi:hypothetical protein
MTGYREIDFANAMPTSLPEPNRSSMTPIAAQTPPPPTPAHIKVRAIRSEKIVMTVQVGTARFKIFQIIFRPDGSLFITVPYFRKCMGILAAAAIPANRQNTSKIDLRETGKVSSHDVKYSHHPSGRAHFSQDGLVNTEIIRQSIALNRYQGHIFSLVAQGLGAFETADSGKDAAPPSLKRSTLSFPFEQSPEPDAIKFVGRWYDVSALPLGNTVSQIVGPVLATHNPDGEAHSGFLIAGPGNDVRHVLFITCHQVPRLNAEPELLLFYGGFDAREIMDDTAREAGFLTFLYPASNPEELKMLLGTIDRL